MLIINDLQTTLSHCCPLVLLFCAALCSYAPMKARKVIDHGKQKFVVQFTDEGRKRRKFFSTKGDADKWIASRRRDIASGGRAVAAVTTDPERVAELAKALAILKPHGRSLLEAVESFVATLEAQGSGITIGEAVDNLVATKRKAGRSPRTVRELDNVLGRLRDHVGEERRLGALSHSDIEGFLSGLPLGAVAWNHYRRLIASLFNFAIRKGWITENPCNAIEQAQVRRGLPEVFTAAQVQRMLATDDAEIRLYVALGAFAGLRPESEVERLTWEQVHLGAGVIDLLETGTKTAQRRQVAILPVLAGILTKHQKLSGPIVGEGFGSRTRWRTFKAGLGFEWKKDGLRHAYGTHHLAAFQDAGRTSLQMGHGGNPAMLFRHYNRPGITQAQGLAYFGLPAASGKAVAQ